MTEKTKTPEPHAGADWTQQVWLWPLEATKLALHSYAQWFADQKPAPSRAPDQEPLAWTTPNAVVLQLPTMRLREFSRRECDAAAGCRLRALCAARRADRGLRAAP